MKITAVVTGATSGIGKEIARGLVRQGATVIIGARSVNKGEAARREFAKEPGGGKIEVLPLDVASMKSVREFAATVAKGHSGLQLLINNAGAMFNERRQTAEGHEQTLATNVLGPYLLTHLLVPQLRAGRPARIVNMVSSLAGNYDPKDLEWEQRKYDAFKVYAQSKQMVRMMTWKGFARSSKMRAAASRLRPFPQRLTGFGAENERVNMPGMRRIDAKNAVHGPEAP